MKNITFFKIKIFKITPTAIQFDLKVGTKPTEVFTTIYTYGSGYKDGNLQLNYKEFTDFVHRLVAYVFTDMSLTDSQLLILWELKINVKNSENPKKAKSIFSKKFINKYVKNNS